MEIFGQHDRNMDDVVVADAVAASFSIPLFFKPTTIRRADRHGNVNQSPSDDRYVDGGLVSNLPVWVFAEDKRMIERAPENRIGPPIPIIAVTLVDANGKPKPLSTSPLNGLIDFFRTVGQMGIFGGQSIVQTFIPNLTVVKVPTPLDVLEFDCTRDRAKLAYETGRDAVFRELERDFQIRPIARRKALEDIWEKVVASSLALRSPSEPVGNFRLSLVARQGDRSFKIVAALKMDQDADDSLVLDEKNPGAPQAWLTKRMTFVDLTAGSSELWMTKYERALVRQTLESVISIPIFASADEWSKQPEDRVDPLGVLCVDSDDVLNREYHDPGFRQMTSIESVKFADFLDPEKG